ncbi:hypothetical protein B0H14DRAFT_3636769 [Mycena olivaceomarginata]|nr:hypothetical protein B0H14DRAFT_3636769 [Mycena olivaceomarginata]
MSGTADLWPLHFAAASDTTSRPSWLSVPHARAPCASFLPHRFKVPQRRVVHTLRITARESSSHCVYAECLPTLRTYIANNVFHHPEQNESQVQKCTASPIHRVQRLPRPFPPQRRRYRRPGSAASAARRQPLTHIATNTSDYVVHPTNTTVRPVQRGVSTVALLAPPPTHLSHPTSLRPPPPVAAAAI